MYKSILMSSAGALVALISQAAWAVSGQAVSITKLDPSWPNGRFFSTADAPHTFYCVSANDPAGNMIFSMYSQALVFVSYGSAPLPTTFVVGNPGGPAFHPNDCPASSYVYGVGLTVPDPVYPYQATKVVMSAPNQPYCLKYTQTYAPGLSNGASVNDPGAQGYLNSLVTSAFWAGPISAVPGGANPQDCPTVDNYVNSVTIH